MLRTKLRTALTAAMKRRDAAAVSALRSALAAIDNAEAVDPAHTPAPGTSATIAGAVTGLGAAEVPRLHLTEDQIEAIVRTEIAERLRAAEQHDALNIPDRAARLRAEAGALNAELP
jgi:uncharacterized protein YqeY